MSLRVWLPLDGDLRNLGASDIKITYSGVTVNNAGKIGGCYSFDGSNDYITLTDSNFPTILAKNFSIAFWVYSDDDNTRSIYFGNYGLSGSGNWFNLEKHTANEIRFWWNNGNPDKRFNSTKILASDGWTHFTLTKNEGTIKTYLNGLLIETYVNENLSSAIPSTATTFRIGGDSRTSGDLMFKGKMNDFRIYDHCLSATEVKEISQGLVLHYKLDSIKIQSGTNLVTGVTAGGRTTKLTDGRIGVQTTGENSDTYFSVNLSENIVKDTQYYLSCEASGISEGAFWGFPLGVQSNSSLLFKIYNGHNEYIFTANDVNWGTNRLFFDDTNRSDWSNKATFWDFQLIKLDEDDTQLRVMDSSGYKYHGTAIGLPILADASSLYSKAIYMNNTSSSNHIEINDIITLSDITVSFWLKASKSKSQVIFADAENSIEFGILNSLGYTKVTPSAKGWTLNNFKNDEWNHIVIVRKDSVHSLFINNNLETQNGANNNYIHQATKTWLLNRSYNNSYAADASISDFRIYATALSQEDIQALYNVRARIDNLGNFHAFEFNENSNKNCLTKSGIMYDNIIEPYLQLSDGSYWKLLLYHYVDNGKNLFTSTNATYCNDFGLYSRLRDIDNYTYNNKYECYVIQDGKEFRWTQTSQPTASSIAGLTTVEGYNNPVNGLAKANQSNTYIGYGAWWGACGCWTKYSTGGKTGIPGFGSHNADGICEKYLALYMRIDNKNVTLEDSTSNSAEFIEI